MKKIAAAFAAICILSILATVLPVGRLWADVATPVSLTVALPDGSMRWVSLQGFSLDLSGTSPVLRPTFSPGPTRTRKIVALKLNQTIQTIVLPDTCPEDLDLAWNGLVMTEGIDYTVNQNAVNLLRPMISGDVYRVSYFVAVSAPHPSLGQAVTDSK